VNRALSAGSACLYGLCHAGIVSAGYSPALGFIHTGKQLSFVYDMADLYKTQLVIPAAFRVVAEGEKSVERRVRQVLREASRQVRLLERIVDDLAHLFATSRNGDPYTEDGSRPGMLWDPVAEVPGGVSYGCDGSGERNLKPER
jgi:CRISPR-associated protein Cas1